MQEIDENWLTWLHDNLERGCDHNELCQKMISKGFDEKAIQAAIENATNQDTPDKQNETSADTYSIDASWLSWIKENINRNCDVNHIYTRLIEKGFDEENVRRAINDAGGKLPEPVIHFTDYDSLSNVAITKNPRAEKYPSDKLQLYTVSDFLTAQECDDIVDLIEPSLQRSTVTTSTDYSEYRTSSTCWLRRVEDEKVTQLHTKICEMLGIQAAYSEGIQGQQYLVGQEFKAHTDAFAPTSYKKFGAEQGQRTWTFMIYLDDTVQGGGTKMVNIDHIFQPKKGMAVVWNNLKPDGSINHDTLHQGMPVEAGKKTIITQWFRDKGTGPIFY